MGHSEGISSVLRSLYFGEATISLPVTSTNIEHVLCMLRLADMYFLEHLKEFCEVWLCQVSVIDLYAVCNLLTHAHA